MEEDTIFAIEHELNKTNADNYMYGGMQYAGIHQHDIERIAIKFNVLQDRVSDIWESMVERKQYMAQ